MPMARLFECLIYGQVHLPDTVMGAVAPPGEFADTGTVTFRLPLPPDPIVAVPVPVTPLPSFQCAKAVPVPYLTSIKRKVLVLP